jgi:cytochrome c-type biogenesis protein
LAVGCRPSPIPYSPLALLNAELAAQDDTDRALEHYRRMLQDDPWSNPGLLEADRGMALWRTKRGPRNASLELGWGGMNLPSSPSDPRRVTRSQLAGTALPPYVKRVSGRQQDCMLNQIYIHLGVALAGLVSFLSPCVLPLVPPYLSYIGGTTIGEMVNEENNSRAHRRVVLASVFFVLGFTTVFLGLGATASLFGKLIQDHRYLLNVFGGVVIVVFGLHFLGIVRVPLLYREARFHVGTKGAASNPVALVSGAYLMGLAFAFGWTPCIGPILGAVWVLAAQEQTLSTGVRLLLVYSLGLGIPFVLAAIAIGPFLGFLKRFRRHLGRVEVVMGLLLVLTGVLMLAGAVREWLIAHSAVFAQVGWPVSLLLTAAGLALLANAGAWAGRRFAGELPARLGTAARVSGLPLLVLGVSLLGASLNDLGTWMIDNVPVLGRIEEILTSKDLRTDILGEGKK